MPSMNRSLNIFYIIIFLTYSCVFSFQNFLFNIVNQCKYVDFRYNCSLQVFSVLNFIGSFFWCYIADRRENHNNVLAFNISMYIVLIIFVLIASRITNSVYQIVSITIITIFREFTLGGILPVFFALVLNYMKRKRIQESKLVMINIFSILGNACVMFIMPVISCTGIIKNDRLLSLTVCIVAGTLAIILLLLKTPKFKKDVKENLTREGRIMHVILKPSVLLYYASVVAIGVYKCIISNFVTTFLQINGLQMNTIRMLWGTRCIAELFTYIIIPYFAFVPNNILFVISILVSALSIAFYIFPELNTTMLVISEVLKGAGTASFVYTSILIFKSYATNDIQTQVQGIRNSAYNGFSCILFGILAAVLIDRDLKDPRTVNEDESDEMRNRMLNVFESSYFIIFFSLLIAIVPAILARFLKKRNK
uniref:MFS n=1 Tax=Trachipleistophora hominis TaxID=72359 RepID=A0A5B8G5V8_TRAHO|nr:MFS [Trachipleistophora hominis]